jgi:hypothetical protein
MEEIKKEQEVKKFKLSHQAMGSFMLALQKTLLEEIDIVEILQDLELQDSEQGLIVLNPPSVVFPKEED